MGMKRRVWLTSVGGSGAGSDAIGMGVDVDVDVDVGVTVGGTRVGGAVGDGVKLGVNVGIGVAVGGRGVGVFDGVAGCSDGVRLAVGSAVSTFGLGPGVDMFVVVDVGKAVSIPGEVVIFDGLHAVKANTIIKWQRFNPFIKRLIPFIFRPYFFLSRSQI